MSAITASHQQKSHAPRSLAGATGVDRHSSCSSHTHARLPAAARSSKSANKAQALETPNHTSPHRQMYNANMWQTYTQTCHTTTFSPSRVVYKLSGHTPMWWYILAQARTRSGLCCSALSVSFSSRCSPNRSKRPCCCCSLSSSSSSTSCQTAQHDLPSTYSTHASRHTAAAAHDTQNCSQWAAVELPTCTLLLLLLGCCHAHGGSSSPTRSISAPQLVLCVSHRSIILQAQSGTHTLLQTPCSRTAKPAADLRSKTQHRRCTCSCRHKSALCCAQQPTVRDHTKSLLHPHPTQPPAAAGQPARALVTCH